MHRLGRIGGGSGETERAGIGKVLLTGASGFLGKVVLARLLALEDRVGPLILLLRAADDAAAVRRVRGEILGSEALGPQERERLRAGLDAGRVTVVAGDLAGEDLRAVPLEAWAGVETVVHCAATVSFEEPLHQAMATNALGPIGLLEAVRRAGAEPHFVHVSTAYAADCSGARVREEAAAHPGLDGLRPAEMLEAAEGWRDAVEEESRQEGRRRRLARAAARDAATRSGIEAGPRAERLRQRWAEHRLGEIGRDYAVQAGWPDTYALTKALGERLLAESCERLTIVRPTIIESSLRQPRPGWLEGIKVADPLILAYAGGALTHLPADETNLIDIVPVDCVANACVAAALYPGEREPRVLAVASTARNPLQIGQLGRHVQSYFSREPLSPGRKAREIPDLNYVDRSSALGAARRRQRIAAAGARAASAPFVPRRTESKLRKLEFLAGQISRMVAIYAPYTELNVVFDDANLCALAERMSLDDRELLPFDVAAFDWTDYLEGIHLPEVRRMARERSG
jgi:nucleoside-diphosphate-sugar epimerase